MLGRSLKEICDDLNVDNLPDSSFGDGVDEPRHGFLLGVSDASLLLLAQHTLTYLVNSQNEMPSTMQQQIPTAWLNIPVEAVVDAVADGGAVAEVRASRPHVLDSEAVVACTRRKSADPA